MRPPRRFLPPRSAFTVNGRPVWRGLPVPWVARWTGEVPHELPLRAAFIDRQLWLTFNDDLSAHPLGARQALRAERDELGLLWLPDFDASGAGEPQFAGLHTGRLRASMLDRVCQVCGVRFPAGEPTTFLDSTSVADPNTGHARSSSEDNQPYVTSTPPTCRSCIPVAMRMCPHNRGKEPHRVIVTAHSYRPAAVIGDLYRLHEGVPQEEELRAVVPLGDLRLSRMITKQLYVQVLTYTTEPLAKQEA